MPHFYKYEWEGFEVKAEPSGIRKLFKFLPYITGSKPIIKFVIRVKEGETRPLEAHLNLYESTENKQQTWDFFSSPDQSPNNIDKKWNLHPISLSTDYTLQVHLILPRAKNPMSMKYNLVTFKAIAQETMLGWTIGTILAIAVLIVGIWNLALLTTQ